MWYIIKPGHGREFADGINTAYKMCIYLLTHQVVLEGISYNMAALVQNGQYGAINTTVIIVRILKTTRRHNLQ